MKDSLGLFEKIETPLEGCFEIQTVVRKDARGKFLKTFHLEAFKELGLETNFVESYYSVSKKNCLRGMHFQTPPADHVKLVYCISGAVIDVVVDIRKNSPTFGKHQKFYLDDKIGEMLYIPKGFAYGFLVVSEFATMVYNVTTVYSPENDKGILWSSCGIDWECENPILSERDLQHPKFKEFNSPF